MINAHLATSLINWKYSGFSVDHFILIPPYIRRYGLYASRTKGKWPDKPHVARLAPAGWKKRLQVSQDVLPYDVEETDSVSDKESRSIWARLIAQVYEVDPLVCPRCSAPMRILAVITEPEEVRSVKSCATWSRLAARRLGSTRLRLTDNLSTCRLRESLFPTRRS